MTAITVTWSVHLEGENAFVFERYTDCHFIMRFGPMPRDFAGPFIDERKERWEDEIKARRGGRHD